MSTAPIDDRGRIEADARRALDPLFDDTAASEYLNTTARHVRELRYRGDLEYVRVGTLPRVRRSELDRYIASRTVKAHA